MYLYKPLNCSWINTEIYKYPQPLVTGYHSMKYLFYKTSIKNKDNKDIVIIFIKHVDTSKEQKLPFLFFTGGKYQNE